MTETERAWAAGFFEGEGSVWIAARPQDRIIAGLLVEVSQVDPEPLRWLHERWGGNIPPGFRQSSKRDRTSFRWRVRAARAAAFLASIEPYLVRPLVRRRVALAQAFQAQKTNTWANRTPEYAAVQRDFLETMRQLNGRGFGYVEPELTPLERAIMQGRR